MRIEDKLVDIANSMETLAKEMRKLSVELKKKPSKKKKNKVLALVNKYKGDYNDNNSPAMPDYNFAKDFFNVETTKKESSTDKPVSRMERMLNKGQKLVITEEEDLDFSNKPKRGRRSPQEIFEEKLEKGKIDEFTATDLVCFFRQCAEKQGNRYLVNWPRDTSMMKRLMKSSGGEFDTKELIMMIEFLYFSKQTYLDKKRLNVGIFTTGWLNKIYQDAIDWVNDEYTEEPKRKSNEKPREWKGSKKEDISVGGLE